MMGFPSKLASEFLGRWGTQVMQKIEDWNSEGPGGRVVTKRWKDADVITSEMSDTVTFRNANVWHKPILDLDFHVELHPSTTEGHYHLYLDRDLTWEQYAELLLVLKKCHIISEGYYEHCMDRGYSAVRLPWVPKGDMEFDSEGTRVNTNVIPIDRNHRETYRD